MSMINLVLSWVEYEKYFITLGPGFEVIKRFSCSTELSRKFIQPLLHSNIYEQDKYSILDFLKQEKSLSFSTLVFMCSSIFMLSYWVKHGKKVI